MDHRGIRAEGAIRLTRVALKVLQKNAQAIKRRDTSALAVMIVLSRLIRVATCERVAAALSGRTVVPTSGALGNVPSIQLHLPASSAQRNLRASLPTGAGALQPCLHAEAGDGNCRLPKGVTGASSPL